VVVEGAEVTFSEVGNHPQGREKRFDLKKVDLRQPEGRLHCDAWLDFVRMSSFFAPPYV